MQATQAVGDMVTDPQRLDMLMKGIGHKAGTAVTPFEALIQVHSGPQVRWGVEYRTVRSSNLVRVSWSENGPKRLIGKWKEPVQIPEHFHTFLHSFTFAA